MSQVLLHDCPQCGHSLDAGALFCDKCGYILQSGQEIGISETITSKLSQPKAPTNLFDTRYPRPFWYRIYRRLAIIVGSPFMLFLGWIIDDLGVWQAIGIIVVIYFTGVIISFLLLNVDAGFTLPHITQALLFNKGDWWKIVLILLALCIIIVTLAVASSYADDDVNNERTEIKEREHAPGLTLRSVFRLGGEKLDQIAWSSDGTMLASKKHSFENSSKIVIWQVENGEVLRTVTTSERIEDIAWSPDGSSIAVMHDDSVVFWNIYSGEKEAGFPITTTFGGKYKIAWSSDKKTLALTAGERAIVLLDSKTGQTVDLIGSSAGYDTAITWMPGGDMLAVCFEEGIQLWDIETRQLAYKFSDWERKSYDTTLACSPNGSILACSYYTTILLWYPGTGQPIGSLEGTLGVTSLSFSSDSRLLAARSRNGYVQIWRTDTWDQVATFSESANYVTDNTNVAFHPTKANILATRGLNDTIIRVWELDLALLLADPAPVASSAISAEQPIRVGNSIPPQPIRIGNPTGIPSDVPLAVNPPMVRYVNAKVVLLGDSGVGKSGLGLVLSRQPFVPTESTHGRRVWTFASNEVELPNGRKETRETLLWDLAGQPGYRLIHQLHLNEVTVAMIVIDARSETDPFAGVYHWERALRQAQQTRGSSVAPVKKFLVAARIDRSGIGVSRVRIEGMLRELGFADYFETSAKDGRGVQELKAAIEAAIAWDNLPWVISTKLFQQIKDFLVAEKEAGRVLSTVDDLYRTFLHTNRQALSEIEDLRAQFETCIGRVESRGLLRQLSFGNLVLLQPELLDAYASALVNEVRDEPDGLGSIPEERIISARFAIPSDERLKDREQEKVLLIAMTEDLLRYELALREQADDGQYLVFPSQSTRENPALPDPEGKAMTFSFEGPVQNIYATLAVRLSHSGFFKKKELWKNAIAYTTQRGGTCGIFLQHTGEGQGRLTIFFDQTVSTERRADFETYIETHLQRKALPASIKCRRVLACQYCHTLVTEETVQKRRAQGLEWLNCPVCDQRVSLLEQDEKPGTAASAVVQKMDRQADIQRDLQTAVSILQGKRRMQDFDVFLCHHGTDKPAVKKIGEQLKLHGLLPWLDEWELRPGLPWQQLLEEQIGQIKSAAVFVGSAGIGPWQHHELDAFLREFVHRGVPVIPVLLPDAPKEPRLPIFLSGMTWVDFRRTEPDPMQRLLWGITGKY